MGKDAVKSDRRDKEFAVIRIQERSSEIEPVDVFVNFNGTRMVIKRDEYVPVPSGVIDILRNATKPVFAPVSESGIMISKRKAVSHAQRFPFELTSFLSEPEYTYLKGIASKRSLTEKEVYDVIDGNTPAEAAA